MVNVFVKIINLYSNKIPNDICYSFSVSTTFKACQVLGSKQFLAAEVALILKKAFTNLFYIKFYMFLLKTRKERRVRSYNGKLVNILSHDQARLIKARCV